MRGFLRGDSGKGGGSRGEGGKETRAQFQQKRKRCVKKGEEILSPLLAGSNARFREPRRKNYPLRKEKKKIVACKHERGNRGLYPEKKKKGESLLFWGG